MELSIVVPTYNERENVSKLIALVEAALPETGWEIVFVDDNSSDGTAEHVRQLAQANTRVRCVHRYGRRGLSSACIEGIMATSSPCIAVMDGDLQHDERILKAMLDLVRLGGVDLVIGSRHVKDGGVGDWSKKRQAISRFATRLARFVTRAELTDPMSGFFMIRREAFMGALPRLSAIGFKILLDILASSPRPLKFREVGYQFRTRQHGESKLDSLAMWEYLQLLLDKTIGRVVPVRFLGFAFVGSIGVVVHLMILAVLFKAAGVGFAVAQAAATGVAISSNFFLNNLLTYRDRRLKGRRLFTGWLVFNLVCVTGAVANVGVATWLFDRPTMWVVSALGGILVGVVWNYAMSATFTWRNKA